MSPIFAWTIRGFSAVSCLRDQISVDAHRGSEWFRDTLLLRDGKWALPPSPPLAYWPNVPAGWKTEPHQEPSSLDQTPWDLVHPESITNDTNRWEIVYKAEADESSQ